MGWLAFLLTPDPMEKAKLISFVLFATQIPLFVLGPIGGVWVDRLNRRKLLIVTQTLSMLQSFALALFTIPHWIKIPELIALALTQGLINALDIPGRQAFLVEMVNDRRDLPNAIALNSTMVHSARLLGPAAAGVLIHFVGVGYCFLLDGFSYLAVIAALVAMRIESKPRKKKSSVFAEMREGFQYVTRFKPARELLILTAAFSLSGVPCMMVLLPIFGAHFGGGGHGDLTFGFLAACAGFGALIGAILLASRKTVVGLGRRIAWASTIYGLAIAAFSQSDRVWLSMLIVPFTGWGMITIFASVNTILQTLTDDDKRGRVMSFFSMAFIGMTPFGILAAGQLATRLSMGREPVVGASRTILIASVVCLVTSVRYWFILPTIRKHVRPIYVKKGILKEIAEGLKIADAPAPTEP
jgi:MFS family permease